MNINRDKAYKIKNRGAGVIIYRIPDANIRRELNPGESAIVTFGELEKLSFQPGGRELMANFLQIMDAQAIKDLNIRTEPEYNMSEQDIIELLKNGSLDQFLDTLDFAPIAVIDLIKSFAVSMPLMDLAKRRAIKDKTGFDVDAAVRHLEEQRIDEEENGVKIDDKPVRRVKPESQPEGRRTALPEYKIVSIEDNT